MKQIRIFSPVVEGKGLKPEEYLVRYPELAEREETRGLRGIELMWCWYYASPESSFVLESMSHEEKCEKITDLIFNTVNKGRSYDEGRIEKLNLGELPKDWKRVIDFFKTRDKKLRERAKSIIDTMFDEFENIVKEGTEQFKDKEGTIDMSKYIMAMKRIREEMPDLIKKKEEGYGVNEHIGISDSITEGDYYNNMYLKLKG